LSDFELIYNELIDCALASGAKMKQNAQAHAAAANAAANSPEPEPAFWKRQTLRQTQTLVVQNVLVSIFSDIDRVSACQVSRAVPLSVVHQTGLVRESQTLVAGGTRRIEPRNQESPPRFNSW
jgi:hypothetical protein